MPTTPRGRVYSVRQDNRKGAGEALKRIYHQHGVTVRVSIQTDYMRNEWTEVGLMAIRNRGRRSVPAEYGQCDFAGNVAAGTWAARQGVLVDRLADAAGLA